MGTESQRRGLRPFSHTRKSARPTGTRLPAASFRPNHLGTSKDAFTQPQLKVQVLILNSEADRDVGWDSPRFPRCMSWCLEGEGWDALCTQLAGECPLGCWKDPWAELARLSNGTSFFLSFFF